MNIQISSENIKYNLFYTESMSYNPSVRSELTCKTSIEQRAMILVKNQDLEHFDRLTVNFRYFENFFLRVTCFFRFVSGVIDHLWLLVAVVIAWSGERPLFTQSLVCVDNDVFVLCSVELIVKSIN